MDIWCLIFEHIPNICRISNESIPNPYYIFVKLIQYNMNIKYICMKETNYSSSNIEYSHNNIRIIDFICVTLPQIPVLHFETRMGIEQ